MTFKSRCPTCQKIYTAEAQWIGKRTRCKKCGNTFVVEQLTETISTPEDQLALSPACEVPSQDVHTAPSGELRKLITDLGDLRSGARTGESRPSTTRVAIEAKLRVILILLAVGSSAAYTFHLNKTGLPEISLLRIGFAFLLYLGVILPFTYHSVAASFRKRRRKLPTGAAVRIAATFALPASLVFIAWQIHETTGGVFDLFAASIIVMFGFFWFQFRLGFLESIGAYIRACAALFTGAAVCGLLVIGVNWVINRALIDAHAVAYKESPLGEPLAWKTPTPVPTVRSELPTSKQPSTTSPAPFPQPDLLNPGFNRGLPATTATSRASAQLFVNPEDDQFLADLTKNSQPWVKEVSRPAGQSPFDFLIVPCEASPYVGFVSMDPNAAVIRRFGVGLAIASRIRRAASFNIKHDANPHAFPRDYLLSSDGTVLLHLNRVTIEIISTSTPRQDTFTLKIPERHAKGDLSPQLVGLARDQSAIVRWAGVGATDQVLQRYSYAARSLIESTEIHDVLLAAEDSAVSTNATGTIWLASIVTPTGQPPSLCLFDLTSAHGDTTRTTLPPDVRDLTNYEHIELAFSPDATQIAAQFTDHASALVYVWQRNALSAAPLKATPPMLPSSVAASHIAGPRIRWIDDQALLVDGQAVISTVPNHGGVIGLLSETPTMAATTIGPDHVLLSYLGTDGFCHLAEIEFDPDALREATPVK